jgi:hypothetical protein
MMRYVGVKIYIAPPSLISVLFGGKWSDSRPDRLTPEERATGTHMIDWKDPTAGLYVMEERKILPCWESNPGPQLYETSYPGCEIYIYVLAQSV